MGIGRVSIVDRVTPYHNMQYNQNSNNLHLSLDSLSPFTLNCETPSINSEKIKT